MAFHLVIALQGSFRVLPSVRAGHFSLEAGLKASVVQGRVIKGAFPFTFADLGGKPFTGIRAAGALPAGAGLLCVQAKKGVPVTLTANLASGHYYEHQTLRVTKNLPQAIIRFTADGRPVTRFSPVLPVPLVVDESLEIRFRAFFENQPASLEQAFSYVIWERTDVKCTPPGRRFYEDTEAHLSLEGGDKDTAELRYTLDKNPVTASSALYDVPFYFDTHAFVRARAFRQGIPTGPEFSWLFLHVMPLYRTHVLYCRFEVESRDIQPALMWKGTETLGLETEIFWQDPYLKGLSPDLYTGMLWNRENSIDIFNDLNHNLSLTADDKQCLGHNRAGEADHSFSSAWYPALALDTLFCGPWNLAMPADTLKKAVWTIALAIDMEKKAAFNRGEVADAYFFSQWQMVASADFHMELPWGLSQPGTPSLPGENHVTVSSHTTLPFLIAGAYIMSSQEISCKRVSDGMPIVLLQGSIRTDKASWAWSFSASLPSKTYANMVQPVNGEPVEIELTVQGYTFRFLVREINPGLTWGKGTWNISGYSPSQRDLGDEAPVFSHDFKETDGQQMAHTILQDTGWNVDWQLPADLWPVNGEYQAAGATRASVLGDIARAAGGVLQTHRCEKKIILKKEYPDVFRMETVTPDDFLVQGMIEVGRKSVPVPGYDAVIVSGVKSGFVTDVRSPGSAGLRPAPAIADPLLTVPWLNVERGRAFLSHKGIARTEHSYAFPLFHINSGKKPALAEPLRVLEVTDPDEDRVFKSVVSSLDISFGVSQEGAPTGVWQKVTLEEYHAQ